MNNSNISFFSLSELSEIVGVSIENLLREARLGKLTLCAETDIVNGNDHYAREVRRQNPEIIEDLSEWSKRSHFVWLTIDQVAEVTRNAKVQLTESRYPVWVIGSMKERQVVYSDQVVIFEEPYAVTVNDLLVLDGDAAAYCAKKQGLALPEKNPEISHRKAPEERRIGRSKYRIYLIPDEFLQRSGETKTDQIAPIADKQAASLGQLKFSYQTHSRPDELAHCIVHYLKKCALEYAGEAPSAHLLWVYMQDKILEGDAFARKHAVTYNEGKKCFCASVDVRYQAFYKRISRLKIRPISAD